MNRRALAWVSAAVVAIVAVAWWLSVEAAAPLPVPVPLAAPVASPMPVAIAVVPELPQGPAAVDAAVEEVDAGRLAEVEIEVYDEGLRQVGIRVELEGPGRKRVGRPLDIMGVARFTLEEGAWRVTSPARRNVRVNPFDELSALALARSTPFEVRAPLTRLRIDLARRRVVRGQVLDAKGKAASGATIEVISECPRPRPLDPAIERRDTAAHTDAQGRFEFEAETESVVIQARSGSARSLARAVTAPGERTLVLEEWTHLFVKAIPGSAPACVRVTRRGEFVTEGMTDRPLEVPVGAVELLALRSSLGRTQSGRKEVTRSEVEDGEAVVRLKPAMPVRGRLVDTSGRPVPGVTVSAGAVDPTRAVVLPDGGVEWLYKPLLAASSISSLTGEFSLAAADCGDSTWLVTVGGVWKTTRQVLVRLDDAPIEVVIEELQP